MSTVPLSQEPYLADKPVVTSAQDEFKRYDFARRIANTIRDRQDPQSLVVGLYGRWGEGKSSVLNFISQELKTSPASSSQVITLTFNPWRFEGEEQLLLGFFTELAQALNASLKTKSEKIGELITEYAEAVIPKMEFLGGLFQIEPSAHLKKIGELLANTPLPELKARLGDLLLKSRKRMVIIIDDIDRLNKHEIYAIFRLVKLTGDFSYTTYLLSFDDAMVARAIGEMYEDSNSEAAGRNFLEKIIQVPLMLPIIQQDAMREHCFTRLERIIKQSGTELTSDDWEAFHEVLDESIITRVLTPRHVARYTNALSFVLPLLKGETNGLDLILIESLRVFYPELYQFIARHQSFVTGPAEHPNSSTPTELAREHEMLDGLTQLLHNYNEHSSNAAFLLARLFPRLSEKVGEPIDLGRELTEAKLYKSKSIASDSFFRRYFSYAVQRGEISESTVSHLRTLLMQEQFTHAYELADRLVEEENSAALLRMLSHHTSEMYWVEMLNWVKLLAHLSEQFHHVYEPAQRSRSLLWQAVTVVISMMGRANDIDANRRLAPGAVMLLAENVFIQAKSFEFSYELMNRVWESSQKANPLLSPQDLTSLVFTFLEQAEKRAMDKGKPIFRAFPFEADFILTTLYRVAYGREKAIQYVNSHIMKFLSEDRRDVYPLLGVFSEPVYHEGELFPQNLTRSRLEHISQSLDVNYLYDRALPLLQDDEVIEYPTDPDNRPEPETLLRQFVYLYQNPNALAIG